MTMYKPFFTSIENSILSDNFTRICCLLQFALVIIAYVLTTDVMTAHRALAAALLYPILDAACVVEMVARTVQFRYNVIWTKWCHANDAFVFITDGSEEVLRKFDPRNTLHDARGLRATHTIAVHAAPFDVDEKANEKQVEDGIDIVEDQHQEHRNEELIILALEAHFNVRLLFGPVDYVAIYLPDQISKLTDHPQAYLGVLSLPIRYVPLVKHLVQSLICTVSHKIAQTNNHINKQPLLLSYCMLLRSFALYVRCQNSHGNAEGVAVHGRSLLPFYLVADALACEGTLEARSIGVMGSSCC